MGAEPDLDRLQSRYLSLDELFIDDLIWVDSADALQAATSYMEQCKVVGVDCEWKPNHVKGSKPNKVLHHLISMIQILAHYICLPLPPQMTKYCVVSFVTMSKAASPTRYCVILSQ